MVWIKSTGEITLWPNLNTKGHESKPWSWGESYDVLNVNVDGGKRDRRNVQFADFDGDGKCDVIYHNQVDRHVKWWRNLKTDGKVSFGYIGLIPNAGCDQRTGVGMFDIALRFADIDGDKRADFLCMAPDGKTTGTLHLQDPDAQSSLFAGYLNTKNGIRDLGQIKFAVGHERPNHRWADVNGDSRTDLLWTEPMTGDTSVWQNEGEVPERVSGSKFP